MSKKFILLKLEDFELTLVADILCPNPPALAGSHLSRVSDFINVAVFLNR